MKPATHTALLVAKLSGLSAGEVSLLLAQVVLTFADLCSSEIPGSAFKPHVTNSHLIADSGTSDEHKSANIKTASAKKSEAQDSYFGHAC